LVESHYRQLLRASTFWGAKTGPNPTDRAKNGSKRHLIADGNGTPLAIEHTGANLHDSEMAVPLVDAIPPIRRPHGRPRKRPDAVLADRAYDAEEKIRQPLRERGIEPKVARRNTEPGNGLGVFRYVIAAAFSWLFKQRRLRVRYEKRDDIHQAFLTIGCLLICWNRILGFCSSSLIWNGCSTVFAAARRSCKRFGHSN
jgi:transposase